MFGYVRPVRDELKCREFDLYRATYCGLCRTMRQRYGLLAPMFLTYDFTFLALLLSENEPKFSECRGRCHANPLKKLPMSQPSEALELAADESVILTWWKLRDGAQDEGIFRGIPSALLSWVLYPAYKKAAKIRFEFDVATREQLTMLYSLEKENCPSIDRMADAFAVLLQRAVPASGNSAKDRSLSLLLYHIGRWIYLIDARDDLSEDKRHGNYNPLVLRYGENGDDDALSVTLEHSLNMARSAFCMLECGCRTPVLENILYLGLPLVQRSVFDGSWTKIKKQKIWSKNT